MKGITYNLTSMTSVLQNLQVTGSDTLGTPEQNKEQSSSKATLSIDPTKEMQEGPKPEPSSAEVFGKEQTNGPNTVSGEALQVIGEKGTPIAAEAIGSDFGVPPELSQQAVSQTGAAQKVGQMEGKFGDFYQDSTMVMGNTAMAGQPSTKNLITGEKPGESSSDKQALEKVGLSMGSAEPSSGVPTDVGPDLQPDVVSWYG